LSTGPYMDVKMLNYIKEYHITLFFTWGELTREVLQYPAHYPSPIVKP